MKNERNYDVIIIGGGHAGCEAAAVSARLGAKTAMLTTSLDTIGFLACSPSFGGPGRGQLLREIDVYGALMPRIIDKSAIHFRHSGKDSARWAPFAIVDRFLYHRDLKQELERIENLFILQDTVLDISRQKKEWIVETATGCQFRAPGVVVAAGTFLKGRALRGNYRQKAGRTNEISADSLAQCLKSLGFSLGVFRTGTGPTVKLPSSCLGGLEKQNYDKKARLFSFKSSPFAGRQVESYKTHTTPEIKELFLQKSSSNKARGPRYCPSLVDKITRFPEKDTHPVFVQPENVEKSEWFLNGLSMDIAESEQEQVVNLVSDLEQAQIVRYGYSVSYLYLKSLQMNPLLESKAQPGMFFAGQVTGSSGYEEAAATGLVAGINAALKAKNKSGFKIDRVSGFLGVLVDDLAHKKINEPYRVLLSRAQNFIQLRCDNADIRQAPNAYNLGLISKKELDLVKAKDKRINQSLEGKNIKLLSDAEAREAETLKRYKRYLVNDKRIDQLLDLQIPKTIDYKATGISAEAIEKLIRQKPLTISQALAMDIPERSIKALALYLQRKGYFT